MTHERMRHLTSQIFGGVDSLSRANLAMKNESSWRARARKGMIVASLILSRKYR